MSGPDRVELALRLGRARRALATVAELAEAHPVAVPTSELLAALRLSEVQPCVTFGQPAVDFAQTPGSEGNAMAEMSNVQRNGQQQ